MPEAVHALLVVCLCAAAVFAAEDAPSRVTNSVGMQMVRIDPGTFAMGQAAGGDFDERPVHKVNITRAFYLGATEVTNAQYEQFDPKHKEVRGKRGFSKDDDEAAVFVSWHDSAAFCQWLSKKEGKPYRLPTEAEWEYACRAGTTSAFGTGDQLPAAYQKNQKWGWDPVAVSLSVAKTPPNAWGLCDVHGNVEEWCQDWYGPYEAGDQTDPVGRADGLFKVTRGGSHNTEVLYLRSANRLGTLPEDKHWLIGFRVAQAEAVATPPLPEPPAPAWAVAVKQGPFEWPKPPDPLKPFFAGPRPFVRLPADANGPMFAKHNHCPSITWCPNGDLLAVWFSTVSEAGREMTILASRLRRGATEWDPASVFFKAPDRNMTGSSLFNDGKGTLYFINGLAEAGGWANLAMVMRTSRDSGATWSRPGLIAAEHEQGHQVISGMSQTRDGRLIQPCDAVHGGSGGTFVHISRDGGLTWTHPGAGTPPPGFQADTSGGRIAGIHAGVAELGDGRLLALGRGNTIDRHMPMSISADTGQTWTYAASPFTPISGGQRLVLMRLREGPLLFCSFTDSSGDLKNPRGMTLTDASGWPRTVFGLLAAVSEDDGKTWPHRRLVTDDGPGRRLNGGAWTQEFLMDSSHAEPRGYLAATQTPDGIIHLVSSALHYAFNLAWLKTPMPAAPAAEKAGP